MQLWNYCAICGKRIKVGEPCLGVEKKNKELIGDSICFDCVKVENIDGLDKTFFITDLLSRAEAAEAAQETLQRDVAEYKARAEKAERERDEYFKHIRGLCFCCAHRTDGFDCKAKCYGHKRGSAWVYAGPAKEE